MLINQIKAMNPFRSQKKQDLWVIFKVMPFKFNGFFLELAAFDGITHSNTYVLEKMFNWKGICVEPNPAIFEKLKINRKCIINNSVVSDVCKPVFFRTDNGVLAGIVSDETDNNYTNRGEELKKADIIKLKTTNLTDLLDELNAPKIVDYFSLDVEGSEEAIIRGLDFKKYKFGCLTIERPTPLVNEILFENDYLFVKNYKNDSFYVHKNNSKNLKLQKFEQIPSKNW